MIVERLKDNSVEFPCTLKDFYTYGTRAHCTKCGATLFLDGTIFRGIYHGQRLGEDPVFSPSPRSSKKSQLQICKNFCNNPKHPLKPLPPVPTKQQVASKDKKKVLKTTPRPWSKLSQLNAIDRCLVPRFQVIAEECPGKLERGLPDNTFLNALESVLHFGVSIKSVRTRYAEYSVDSMVKHTRRGSQKLFESAQCSDPLDATLSHISGAWTTTEKGCQDWIVNISATGQTTYVHKENSAPPQMGGMFTWVRKTNEKFGSLVISGGHTMWRLRNDKSTDKKLVFTNQMTYSRHKITNLESKVNVCDDMNDDVNPICKSENDLDVVRVQKEIVYNRID
jgi:hypothetical protein